MRSLCLGLCALLCQAEQHDLHRKLLEEPQYQAVDGELGLVKPSQARVKKTRTALKAVTARGLERIGRKLNMSSWKLPVPATILSWTLTGKLTEWAMNGYQAPKTQAQMDLADSFIGLFVRAFDEGVKSLSDKELLARLLDWAQIHRAVHRYTEASGQLPEVTKLVDATAEVLHNQTSLNLRKVRELVNQVFAKMRGERPVADVLRYSFDVLTKRRKYDIGTLQNLAEPALREVGAPPALVDLVTNATEQIKKRAPFNFTQMVKGAARALSEASQQLSLPPAFAALFDSADHWFDHQHTIGSLVAETASRWTAVGESMGYPPVVASLPGNVLQCAVDKEERESTPGRNLQACFLVNLANAGDAVGEPPAVVDFLRFLHEAMHLDDDDEDFMRHAFKLCDDMGQPHDLLEHLLELDKAKKGGVKFDEAQKLEHTTKLLRFMGMPATSTIVSIVGQAALDNKKPTEQNYFRILVSLFEIPADFKRVRSAQKSLTKKMLAPALAIHRHAVLNLTHSMPGSPLSAALSRSVLSAP